jgi:hypothetical protein
MYHVFMDLINFGLKICGFTHLWIYHCIVLGLLYSSGSTPNVGDQYLNIVMFAGYEFFHLLCA